MPDVRTSTHQAVGQCLVTGCTLDMHTQDSLTTLQAAVSPVDLLRAIVFAADKHRQQRRKDADASPYINHPIAARPGSQIGRAGKFQKHS